MYKIILRLNLGIILCLISQFDKLRAQIQYKILHKYHRYMTTEKYMNYIAIFLFVLKTVSNIFHTFDSILCFVK